MTEYEMKLRQITNQYLITPGEKLTVLRNLNGFQAQFMTNAIHSMKLRCLDSSSYGIVKNWTIRGTVHIFAESDLALYKHCQNGTLYRSMNFSGYTNCLTHEPALTPERQQYFSRLILDALQISNQTRDDLKYLCRNHGMTQTEEDAMFDQWGGGIRDLCERGFMNYVVQEKKVYCLCPPFIPLPESEAQLEIARRYFTNIAPATIEDAVYYFHATRTQVKMWLSQLPVTSVDCNGKTYYYIENGKTYNTAIPDCIFLAGFDQLLLGYQKTESLYLPPEHLRKIFNLAGIINPSILYRGKIIGRWKKKNKKLHLTIFDPISPEDHRIIENHAEQFWNDIKKIEWL